jgi:HsdM N-terminal domain
MARKSSALIGSLNSVSPVMARSSRPNNLEAKQGVVRLMRKITSTRMTAETHFEIANFIWGICNLLRGPYKRNEYRKVILPLTVLRRFDCILAPTKAAVLKEHAALKTKSENIIRSGQCGPDAERRTNLR